MYSIGFFLLKDSQFIFCWATMYGYKENQLSNILASKYEWKYAGKSTKLIF